MAEEIRFTARDGRALAGQLFAAEDAKGTVVIASAMGVAQRYYAPFAEHLAHGGLTTLTFDYRGVAASREGSLRRDPSQLHDWGELDLAGAFDQMKQRAPALPLQLVSHSVGGQLFGLVQDAPVHGAIFVGSQSGAWRHWTGLGRVGMFALWHLAMPAVAATLGYIPMGALGQGEDLPAGVGAEWARWGRDRDYVWSYARSRGGLGFARFDGPIRSYAIADDAYAPRSGVEGLLAMYARAKVELRVVSPAEVGARSIGHFGLFRERFRDTLWTELRETLLARTRAPREESA